MSISAVRTIRMAPHILACLAAISACEAGVDQGDDESVTTAASTRSDGLLATIRLSDTHVVEFYETAPGNGLVSEDYDVDRDEGVVKDLELEHGELLPAYKKLAGDKASAEALANLEAYEARRAAFVPANDGEGERAAITGKPENMVLAPVNKDRTSDAYWFASVYCDYAAAPDGCLGNRGSRYSWLPSDLPVCTNVVELCATGFADPFRDRAVKSNNMKWAAYNQASAGASLRAVYYLVDPCEHDSWWDRTFTVCKKGGLGHEFFVSPRHARESTSTASVGWTRQVEITGNSPIGVKVNTY